MSQWSIDFLGQVWYSKNMNFYEAFSLLAGSITLLDFARKYILKKSQNGGPPLIAYKKTI